MSTSATSSTSSVIGRGVFTGGAVGHQQAHNMDTFVFSNRTVRVHHTNGKGRQSFNPKTCLISSASAARTGSPAAACARPPRWWTGAAAAGSGVINSFRLD